MPGIHVLQIGRKEDVGGRDKPGHDSGRVHRFPRDRL
jgi:hypothetical protein